MKVKPALEMSRVTDVAAILAASHQTSRGQIANGADNAGGAAANALEAGIRFGLASDTIRGHWENSLSRINHQSVGLRFFEAVGAFDKLDPLMPKVPQIQLLHVHACKERKEFYVFLVEASKGQVWVNA